jgi:hypothetical protein
LQLKEPLIPRANYDQFMHVVRQPQQMESCIASLPEVNRLLLNALLSLWREVLQYSDVNRMSVSSLAIVFSPGLFGSNTNSNDPMSFLVHGQDEARCVELLIRMQ